jgi:hypothetical protein
LTAGSAVKLHVTAIYVNMAQQRTETSSGLR